MSVQGMPVSNHKAGEKEAARNRKRLLALIKKPENQICMDCPAKLTQNAWASINTELYNARNVQIKAE